MPNLALRVISHLPARIWAVLLARLFGLKNVPTVLGIYEPHRDKTNKMACAPSEDSDQPGHPPSLIRVFAVRMKKAWVLSYPLSAQRRLWSDWADAPADLSLRWVHMPFCWFCHDAAHIEIKVYLLHGGMVTNGSVGRVSAPGNVRSQVWSRAGTYRSS